MRSLLLGLDASPKRLGWGLCDLVTGEPVACGCEVLWTDRELRKLEGGIDWTQQRIRVHHALSAFVLHANGGANHWSAPLLAEVQAVYAEYPISHYPRASFDNGRALGFVQAEVERRWPHAPWQELRPGEWRVLAGLPGNATKQQVMMAAWGLLWHDTPLHTHSLAQDAADALLIAVAGQKRNAETWERGAA